LPASTAEHQTTLAQLSAATQLQAALTTAVRSYVTPVNVVAAAPRPLSASGLRPSTGSVLGLLLGLVVGAIVASVRAARGATGGGVGRFVAAAGVPLIATLPDPAERPDRRPSEEALDGGRTAAAALSPARTPTALITGLGPSGPRARVARLVAEAAAAAGRPTTLVDADLRRPARGAEPGLAGLLRAEPAASADDVRAATSPTAVSRLSELRSGPDPGTALDLVRGPALPPILAALHREGELVLLDGPSLDSPEVRAVAEAAGDVLVVVTRSCKPEDVEAGVAALRAAGADVIGFVEVRAHRRLLPAVLTRSARTAARASAPPASPPTPPRPASYITSRVDEPGTPRPASNGWAARIVGTADACPAAVSATERDAD
jgi:Mrp family chromosome partitioning ATPase